MAPPDPDRGVQKTVVVVDDEENLALALSRLLRSEGWSVHIAHSGLEGLKLVEQARPQVVLSDYRMPGMSGAEFLTKVKESFPDAQRIMLTGHADEQSIAEAVNLSEVFRFVPKPWDNTQLMQMVESAYDHHRVLDENRRLQEITQRQNTELRDFASRLEAKVAERTRQLSEAKSEWEASFDAIHFPLAIVGEGYEIQRANRAYAEVAGHPITDLGKKPLCHRFLFGREQPCPHCPLEESLRTGSARQLEMAPASRSYVLSTYPLAGGKKAVCTYRDVTQERSLTRKLVEAEKMAAVGQLAGGVAREINNPLGAILAFAQILRREAGRSTDDEEGLAVIEEAAVRCKHIVDSLLKFSRKTVADDRESVDSARCIEDAIVLFRAHLKSSPRARLEVITDVHPPNIVGNASQLGQVALNLLQNALHALPGGVGTIRVSVGSAAGRSFFAIEDNGRGIPPQNMASIFEPWFTTMPAGEGPGLGLAISRRIVESHGGTIEVSSTVGVGSTFTTSFPNASLNPSPSEGPDA